jgi:hypothetical protein
MGCRSRDIDVAVGIDANGVAFVIPMGRAVVALEPELFAVGVVGDGHDVVGSSPKRRVAGDIEVPQRVQRQAVGRAWRK